VLPAVVAAEAGVDTVVVAAQNVAEAALVPGLQAIGASSLMEVIVWLRGGPPPALPAVPDPPPGPAPDSPSAPSRKLDLADVLGQAEARLAVEICAAGGHNLSLLGPPGAGKTMLAERLPTILPPLELAAAIEVTSIHSVAGRLAPDCGLMTVPPYCAPHHTSSMAAIVGGGSGGVIRPGAASLAHRGILFLDEAPEFHRDVLDALRQPLESGQVVLARAATQAVFPARFTLVLASNPCPCAKSAGPGKTGCSCSPATRRRYLARISGPLLDRVDVKVRLQPVSRRDMLYDRKFAEPSAVVAGRVAAARERCAARLAGTPWRLNAEVPGTALRNAFPPRPGALTWLDRAMELGQVSARGADKIVRVAWSLADLADQDKPGPDQVNLAIGLWLGVAQ
jgi:magnesium chelatase family protein